MVKVGLSTTGTDVAKKNMEKECVGWDFDRIRKNAVTTWNEYLNKIEISPMNEGQRISFYTALYHTLVMPNKITDVDGSYSLPDGTKIERGSDRYTNFHCGIPIGLLILFTSSYFRI
jgi:putative alpha-1,2-mannosidase